MVPPNQAGSKYTPDNIYQQRQYYADQNHRGDRNINTGSAGFNTNIPGSRPNQCINPGKKWRINPAITNSNPSKMSQRPISDLFEV